MLGRIKTEKLDKSPQKTSVNDVLELYAAKVARTVLTGGKFVRIYLSELGQ